MRYSWLFGLWLMGCLDTDKEADTATDTRYSSLYGPDNQWYHAEKTEIPSSSSMICGHLENDILCNFTMQDQNGDQVELYQFAGKVIFLEIVPAWDGYCKEKAGEGQWNAFNSEYYDDVAFISVMRENNAGATPNVQDVQNWATNYEVEYPVLADTENKSGIWISDIAYPVYVIIDREMTVVQIGNPNPNDVEQYF
jgi:hypothetical protein